MLESTIWIAAGSALGGLGRFWLSELFAYWFGSNFPWGTVIVNITGCFIIGFFATITGPDGRFIVPTFASQFVTIGFCGGYTTFSSFGLQTLNMMQRGEWGIALLHVSVSVVMCLLAVWGGTVTAQLFNPVREISL